MKKDDQQIKQIMEVLSAWNPLGSAANSIKDLDNYKTEASDIHFHASMAGPSTNVAGIVRDVLNEAFNLSLSTEDCSGSGKKIAQILK